MSQDLLRSLVWMDYRLAVLFTVILPLILLIWAFVKRAEAMQRLLIIYWRVASLLAITIYLLIGNFPIGFMTGFLACILIPLSLWFWADLNEEIYEQSSSPLKLTFTSWRWAVSVYSILGAIASIPFLQCAISQAAFATPFCQVWLEAPLGFKDAFHPKYQPGFLGFLGITALIIYVLYFGYFVLVRLGKQGRSAVEQ
ncbi:MAG: DUF3177 family protein [Leptolyngbya sp. IPPAS B-1204]|uniref:DUF3177 family protein n=1 Tax=Leptolyngbya sp. NK1-12 TaxID=2547451 RepID=A0AA96WGE4_9CYAN|nr:DUF3177 family protein [Leptolyngbya sp. NK1-12]MBF2050867.1 DUF3177 family protein [Elainella sp. C42_A2020_010]RNJ67261.1 MAG: DUF3177 family protein [Leptolyngbya sp. IPPAS B-1204]WNZ21876.1 DUF3177 family protein [Leptolyngbya sp. NK1-12]